jgi:hypothetical protein
MDPLLERTMLGVAHALFMNRLHVLRLTEVVRLGIGPDAEDGIITLPDELDLELRQQAIDFVLTCLPPDLAGLINHAKADWLQPA